MKKILLTGTSGFIGRHLIKELQHNGKEIIIVTHNREYASSCMKTIYCPMNNYRNLYNLVEDGDIDTCIHLAWMGSSGTGRGEYSMQLANVEYSMDLIESLAKMGVHTFVGAGTQAERDVLAYHSTDGATPNIVSLYGIAKMTAHYMTKTICSVHKIKHNWCYFANIYGEGNTTSNFINFACDLMLHGKRASFTSAEQWYDFIYIDDAIKALCAVAEYGKKNTAYFIGSGEARRLKDYIICLRDNIDTRIPLYFGEIPFNGISMEREMFDITKLTLDTGFCPQVSFEDGIKRTLRWINGD